MSLETFKSSYLETALWVLERDGDFVSLAFKDLPETGKEAESDCTDFFKDNKSFWDNDVQAGHDFYLTRNEHGAGFWDGDYPEPQATQLTAASKIYGGTDYFDLEISELD